MNYDHDVGMGDFVAHPNIMITYRQTRTGRKKINLERKKIKLLLRRAFFSGRKPYHFQPASLEITLIIAGGLPIIKDKNRCPSSGPHTYPFLSEMRGETKP